MNDLINKLQGAVDRRHGLIIDNNDPETHACPVTIAEVKAAIARITEVGADNAKLRAMLRDRFEWSERRYNGRYCRVCGKSIGHGHADDCELAKLLGDAMNNSIPTQCPGCNVNLVPFRSQEHLPGGWECPQCQMMFDFCDGQLRTGKPVGIAERQSLTEACEIRIKEEISKFSWPRRIWHKLFPLWFAKHTIQKDNRLWCQLTKDRS